MNFNIREDLSGITKDIANKVLSFYDYMAENINTQRNENLKLQLEIAELNKSKNEMLTEVKAVSGQIKRIESQLGVKKDLRYESIVNGMK